MLHDFALGYINSRLKLILTLTLRQLFEWAGQEFFGESVTICQTDLQGSSQMSDRILDTRRLRGMGDDVA